MLEWATNTPLRLAIFVAIVTATYLLLMSINPYIPPILILSIAIGYLVYFNQTCYHPITLPQTTSSSPSST